MNDADDLAVSLIREARQQMASSEKHLESHLERLVGRAILKIGIVGGVSVLATVAGAAITVTAYFGKLDTTIALQQAEQARQRDDISKMGSHCPECAINAQRAADLANAKIDGHLSPDVVRVKTK